MKENSLKLRNVASVLNYWSCLILLIFLNEFLIWSNIAKLKNFQAMIWCTDVHIDISRCLKMFTTRNIRTRQKHSVSILFSNDFITHTETITKKYTVLNIHQHHWFVVRRVQTNHHLRNWLESLTQDKGWSHVLITVGMQ